MVKVKILCPSLSPIDHHDLVSNIHIPQSISIFHSLFDGLEGNPVLCAKRPMFVGKVVNGHLSSEANVSPFHIGFTYYLAM